MGLLPEVSCNTLLYSFFLKNIFEIETRESVRKKQDTYIEGGYVQADLKYYQPKAIAPHRIDFREDQIEAFEKCLALLKDHHIPVLLVYAPVSNSLYQSITNTAGIDSLFQSYGYYLNFNERMDVTDSLDFKDDDHLNQIGVNRFNEILIQYLQTENLSDN